MQAPHLLLALSGHGYGHLAQCAPVVNALWRAMPGLQLTVSGNLPQAVIAERLDRPFDYCQAELDPVLCMFNAWEVDVPASQKIYRDFHRNFESGLARDVAFLDQSRPDLILADIPYRILLAATQLQIPAVGLCSLNWAAIYAAYCEGDGEDRQVLEQMRAGYRAADLFLAPVPAIPMPELENLQPVGPIARQGTRQKTRLLAKCGASRSGKLVLVALGGIVTDLPLDNWPCIENVTWIFASAVQPGRDDLIALSALGMSFIDVLASADLVLTKPGYGTYAEAVCNAVPVLSIERPDWPETTYLNGWVRQHGYLDVMTREQFQGGTFAPLVKSLLGGPQPGKIDPTGVDQAVGRIQALLAPDR
jgi:hypothetical protein